MKDPAYLEVCPNDNKDDQQIYCVPTSKCNLAALCNFYQWYELLVLNRVSQKSNDTLVCNIYSYLALPIVSRALIIPVYNVWKMLTFWEIYIHIQICLTWLYFICFSCKTRFVHCYVSHPAPLNNIFSLQIVLQTFPTADFPSVLRGKFWQG